MFLLSLLVGCDSTLTVLLKDETGEDTVQSGDNDGNGHGDGDGDGDGNNEADCDTDDTEEDVEEDTGEVAEEVETDPKANCVGVEEQNYYSRGQIYAVYELTHTYDEEGRETSIEYDYALPPGAEYVISYDYDDHGNISSYSYYYPQQNTTYSYSYLYVYDTNDRLVQTGYDYDNNGSFEYMTYYTYDDSGLSRSGLMVYDYGYTIYTYSFEETLDAAGRVLQQEMDSDGNGVTDSRTLNLYSGDLLLETLYEQIYDSNRDGVMEIYSYSYVYDYDANGFLTSTGYDYTNDGTDDYVTVYTNNADGLPTLIETIQVAGFRTYTSTDKRTYDADGRLLSSTIAYQNRIYQVNNWTWTCN